jgi:hypothetical protein
MKLITVLCHRRPLLSNVATRGVHSHVLFAEHSTDTALALVILKLGV